MTNESDSVEQALLGMQLESDIRSLLREGFSPAEVLKTLGFRVTLISHLAAAAEIDFASSDPMKPVLEHLVAMVNTKSGARTKIADVSLSKQEIDVASQQVMIELRHLEVTEEVPTESLNAWQSSLINAISKHGEVLDATILAREMMIQLADMEQGSGVWSRHSK